ncbi:MAG: helical backbone metal receptor [Chitinophagaceae bacterium]
MQAFTDQTGHTIFLENTPKRIISLVPSQTELLFDLGLDEEVIAITKFCVHPPEWFYTKRRIGGTKKLHIDIIHQLQPDLIIANKEENVKEQIEELAKDYPVWISDVTDLPTAYEMIEQIGLLTGKYEKAKDIVSTIKADFSQLQYSRKPKTCYLIWNDPYMTVGGDTFIHSMMESAGFGNIFKSKQRYPVVTTEDLVAADCELLLLSSEPFPFKQKHIDELKESLNIIGLPNIKIALVDGEMFSWYGSRLQHAPHYFKELHTLLTNRQ